MMALLLHCADISNAVKPFAIAEKCAPLALLLPSAATCSAKHMEQVATC